MFKWGTVYDGQYHIISVCLCITVHDDHDHTVSGAQFMMTNPIVGHDCKRHVFYLVGGDIFTNIF